MQSVDKSVILKTWATHPRRQREREREMLGFLSLAMEDGEHKIREGKDKVESSSMSPCACRVLLCLAHSVCMSLSVYRYVRASGSYLSEAWSGLVPTLSVALTDSVHLCIHPSIFSQHALLALVRVSISLCPLSFLFLLSLPTRSPAELTLCPLR